MNLADNEESAIIADEQAQFARNIGRMSPMVTQISSISRGARV
jgi:hypothetical protein